MLAIYSSLTSAEKDENPKRMCTAALRVSTLVPFIATALLTIVWNKDFENLHSCSLIIMWRHDVSEESQARQVSTLLQGQSDRSGFKVLTRPHN